jgi:hypothetical protein
VGKPQRDRCHHRISKSPRQASSRSFTLFPSHQLLAARCWLSAPFSMDHETRPPYDQLVRRPPNPAVLSYPSLSSSPALGSSFDMSG